MFLTCTLRFKTVLARNISIIMISYIGSLHQPPQTVFPKVMYTWSNNVIDAQGQFHSYFIATKKIFMEVATTGLVKDGLTLLYYWQA